MNMRRQHPVYMVIDLNGECLIPEFTNFITMRGRDFQPGQIIIEYTPHKIIKPSINKYLTRPEPTKQI